MRKIVLDNKPIIFKNNDFQTIMIQVKFPFKRNSDEIALKSILPPMLNTVCNKYPNEREFFQTLQKLYINGCYCNSTTLIDYCSFNFNFVIPDTNHLGKDILEEQFKFFHELIYNPKHKNNKFYHDEFDREVKSLKIEIEKAFQDCNHYAAIKAEEAFDKDGLYSSSLYNHQEEIDLMNESNLYSFYLDKIYNNHPFIFVFGNVDKERISELCNKYLYRTKFDKTVINFPVHHFYDTDKAKYIEEKSSFTNSVYYSFYTVKDMKEKDTILLGTINGLLSSPSSRLLNKTLRDENELVYSCFSNNSNAFGVLNIVAYIQDKNIEIVREKIREVLNNLKDEEKILECLNSFKESFRILRIRKLDSKVALFKDAITDKLKIDYTDDYYYNELLKITPHDISKFVDRITLDTEYFLKEGSHE